MIKIIAASSLHHSLKSLPQAEQDNLSEIISSFPGLNLDPTNNHFVYPYLTSAPLRNVQLILWHELLNNTLTSHPKKKNIPQTVPQLIETLKSLQNLFCVVTCQRDGDPYIFEDLLKALPCYVIDVTKHIISAIEQLNDTIISQYKRLHQSADLELRSLSKSFITKQTSNELSKLEERNAGTQLTDAKQKRGESQNTFSDESC